MNPVSISLIGKWRMVVMGQKSASPVRRIEGIINGRPGPLIPMTPVASSAELGWQGFLLEQHASHPGSSIEIPEHYSTKHFLHLNTGGPTRTAWRVDGKLLHSVDHPDSVTILPAGSRSLVQLRDKTSGTVLEIDPSHLRQTLTEEARGAKIELTHLFAVPDRQIKLLMTAMQEDLAAGASAGKLYGESLGNALAVYVVGRYSTSTLKFEKFKGGLTKAQLNHVTDYIEQHIDGNPGLQELAEIAGLSIYHFAKQFRHSTGFAPHRYLLQRKIERAKEFLRDPRRSVLEASVRSGFVDQSHFGKMFRRMVGVTPTEFRSRI